MEREINKRAEGKCELCKADENLKVYEVQPVRQGKPEDSAYLCPKCIAQIEDMDNLDPNHWHCLNDSMWSEVPAVQILSYRLLKKLGQQDTLEMMYLDEDMMEWAKALDDKKTVVHKDSNGVILEAGDSVVLIKDLKVKGSSMVAKRGTAVRRIRLDPDNGNFIEGKVEGQTIVIITEYVKKTK